MHDFEQRNIKDGIKARRKWLICSSAVTGFIWKVLHTPGSNGFRRRGLAASHRENRSKWLHQCSDHVRLGSRASGARRVPPLHPVRGELLYPLTPPALFVTARQQERQGPGGARASAPPLPEKATDEVSVGDDREVRGPRAASLSSLFSNTAQLVRRL